jgi:hypothetical protein
MAAGQDGTGAQSSSGLRERVSETGTRKERPLEGRSRPRGAKEAAILMEECLLAPHCRERHRATGCERFKSLSLQHRRSVIAEKELCANCLRHSDLDASKKRDCNERAAEPHWVGISVRRPGKTPSPEREMPSPVDRRRARRAMPAGWMSWPGQRRTRGRRSKGRACLCCSVHRGR